eukprot:361952-Chlamydomonas_euryale.AAC.3
MDRTATLPAATPQLEADPDAQIINVLGREEEHVPQVAGRTPAAMPLVAVEAQIAAASGPLNARAPAREKTDVVQEPSKNQMYLPNSVLTFFSVMERSVSFVGWTLCSGGLIRSICRTALPPRRSWACRPTARHCCCFIAGRPT